MGKYKVGETVKTVKDLKDYTRTIPSGSNAKIVSDYGNGWYDIEVDGKVYGHSVADTNLAKNAEEPTAANLAAPLSAHEATKLLIAKRTKANQYAKVEPGTLYYRALGAIYAVPDTDVNRAAIEAIGSRVLPLKEGGVVGNGEVVENAAYSDALKIIMDSVKGYMDRRIKGDDAWRYPNYVITILRKVCDTATMSAGRYDGKRPPHRIYNVECTLRGWKFQGNLICTGLLHKDDPDDVSAFDEYDMTLSLMNVGKENSSRNSVVSNALAWKRGVANSVCNAKFKVGDRVRLKKYGNQIGTIIRLGHNINGKNNLVKFDDGSFADDIFKDGELELLANSSGAVANASMLESDLDAFDELFASGDYTRRDVDAFMKLQQAAEREGKMPYWRSIKSMIRNSSNAILNARFKPGDKVVVHWGDWRGDDPATIVEQGDYGWIVSFDKYAKESEINEKIITPRNSRNAVVNAALAWKKAVNFQPLPSFKVGQKVKFWDRKQAAYYDGIYSVKKVLNPYEVELEGSDGKMRPGNKCDVRRIVAA